MKTTSDVFRERIKGFLALLKSRMLLESVDTERLDQLRRLSDVRIRQFTVGRTRVTPVDICGLLEDSKSGRFDAPALEFALLNEPHLAVPLATLGEEMSCVVEACLSLQVIGAERMGEIIRMFVEQHGPPPQGAWPQGFMPVRSAPAPLPPEVERLLGKVPDLWAPPPGARRIMEMLLVPETPAEMIVAELKKEPDLSAQLLKLLNAVSFASNARITSTRSAADSVAYPALRRAVSLAAFLNLFGKPHPEIPLDFSEFWRHSLWTAQASFLVARATRIGNAEDHFFSGLVHDIGKLVLCRLFRTPMRAALEAVKAGARYEEAETKALGVNHATAGACVAERWGFPKQAVAAIRSHLELGYGQDSNEIQREALVVAATCRWSRPSLPAREEETWCTMLRLTAPRLSEIREQATQLSGATLKDFLGTA